MCGISERMLIFLMAFKRLIHGSDTFKLQLLVFVLVLCTSRLDILLFIVLY